MTAPVFIFSAGTTVTVGETLLGEAVSVSGIGNSVTMVDITVLASTRKTYMGGLPDGKDCTITFKASPSAESFLLGLSQSPASQSVTIVGTDTSSTTFTITFTGILSDYAIDNIAIDDVYGSSCTFKINSDITYA
jgi:hypothetical protein